MLLEAARVDDGDCMYRSAYADAFSLAHVHARLAYADAFSLAHVHVRLARADVFSLAHARLVCRSGRFRRTDATC